MQAIAVPAFADNYIWLLPLPDDDGRALIVDPGDAAPVLQVLTERRLTPAAILVTHHHYDHVGGIRELRDRCAIPVYGPAGIPAEVDCVLGDGDRLEAWRLQVLATPGHTRDHLCYAGEGLLFCGDTLFAGGCGRLFEGTAEQMYHSLEKLRRLPDDTRVYCAHEYTLSNLRFAVQVEPDNEILARRLQEVEDLRRAGKPTVPSLLGLEKQTNPFLRCHLPAVQRAAEDFCGRGLTAPEQVFAVIRHWKDIS